MNGKDKISVIIPCYNVQKYIMRCFDSIYSQTYGFENLEVILIDDLSTDNTWSILESLQRQYPENVISLKIQKKGKCGGARNLGMDICTGKYITFVDADDYVHPDMLRVLYDRMTEDDYDVAQCGVSCFKADKPNVLEVNDFEIQRLDLDNVDNRKNLIIGLTGFTNVTAWAKLYSTKFIIEHNLRFIEDVYYEDTHFSMLCVLLAKKYCKVQSTLYYYFENTEGIIRSEISNAKIRDAKIIMDHIRRAIQSRKAELGNVIEQCYCEIQTFLLWHQYIEPYSRIETFMNRELDICKEEFLKSEPDIFNNPYVKFFSDDVVLKRMSKLRVTAKKMDNAYILDNISYKLDTGLSRSDMESAATVSDYLMLRVYQGLSRQRERIGDEEAYEQFVREATLKAVDDGWVELIDYLEQLKYAVAGRASAQRNVMFEYQNEAFESFLDTEKAVKCNIIRNILLSDVKIGKDGRLQVIYP